MPSQWNRLCEILERAQSMPAKSKAAYVKAAFTALALECHAKVTSARALRAMPSKMKRKTIGHKANGQKPHKKRRSLNLAARSAVKKSDVQK
jgi:hypothetical protein